MFADWRVLNLDETFRADTTDPLKQQQPPPKPLTKKPKLVVHGLPSRIVEKELGETSDRSKCFCCSYVGEQAGVGEVASEELQSLMDKIRDGLPGTTPRKLVIDVAEEYEKIRKEANRFLKPGQEPLPPMTAADWLAHLRYHNNDPELRFWFDMTDLNELQEVALEASVVQNEETKEILTDEKQVRMYLEILKTKNMMYKMDVTKMRYYSGGKHINPESCSEGIIRFSNKNLFSYWRKKK